MELEGLKLEHSDTCPLSLCREITPRSDKLRSQVRHGTGETWDRGDMEAGETWGQGDMEESWGRGGRGNMGAEETRDRAEMQGHAPLFNDPGWCFRANFIFLAQHNSSETFKVLIHFGTCLSSAC